LITLPALFYLDGHADDPEMQSILAGHFFSDERMDRLVTAIRSSGSIQRAMAVAKDYVNCGLETLHKQPVCKERTSLDELARYIVDRNI